MSRVQCNREQSGSNRGPSHLAIHEQEGRCGGIVLMQLLGIGAFWDPGQASGEEYSSVLAGLVRDEGVAYFHDAVRGPGLNGVEEEAVLPGQGGRRGKRVGGQGRGRRTQRAPFSVSPAPRVSPEGVVAGQVVIVVVEVLNPFLVGFGRREGGIAGMSSQPGGGAPPVDGPELDFLLIPLLRLLLLLQGARRSGRKGLSSPQTWGNLSLLLAGERMALLASLRNVPAFLPPLQLPIMPVFLIFMAA